MGPGTKLEKRLARGDPGINRLDRLAKQHDIDCSKAKSLQDKWKADTKMIKGIDSDHMKNVRKTWIGINHLIGRNKRRCKPIVALPNVLNEFFSSVGQTLAASVPPANHHFSDYLPAVNSPSSFFFEPVTSMELETEILLIPSNKSHGLYSCPVRVLKSSSSVLSLPLAHIINK